jgi:hypothetical protein
VARRTGDIAKNGNASGSWCPKKEQVFLGLLGACHFCLFALNNEK